ncbi:dna-directed rna polymerase i and iii 14 kda polypeptide [Histomonas meleagridis]|uniref:dna-directed rna polymerase i and iii 14 kda polypeptide n=1 Tax=Histomonas meleagridis TaxID=135588 RepID=UPI00355A9942|nr:dna-directed rna polymerase i and iii 14 kda polypeptide [Histomonas meleagridis]
MEEPVSCSISLDDNSANSGTFVFEGERHTMGNAIRQTILPDPRVEFCAYSVPHPAQNRMRIRIQSHEGENIVEILSDALDNFSRWCQNVEDQFFDSCIRIY